MWTFRGARWNVDDVRVCAGARETSMQRWPECAVGMRGPAVVAIGVVASDFALADLPFLK